MTSFNFSRLGEEVNGNTILYETNCTSEVLSYVPSCLELFQILATNGWIILLTASLALCVITALFFLNLVYILKNLHTRFKFSTGLVLSVHPIIGLCMYLEILFPKANQVLDAAAQLWFVFCMYQFFLLTISYFGGETKFVENFQGSVLPWRNFPCCFWPCVWPCLPKEPANKKQIRMIRILILQHPFVQMICTIVGLTFYIEDWFIPKDISASNSFIYLYGITTISFLLALWSFIVCFKASRSRLKGFKYCGKVASFQLTLIFVRLQSIIFNSILIPAGAIPCLPPLSPKIFGNLVLSSLILGQLAVLSVMAYHFYRLSKADHKDYNPDPKSQTGITNGGIYFIESEIPVESL